MWEFIRQVGGEAPNGLLRLQHLHMLVACRASAPIHQLELIAQHEHDQGGQNSPTDHLHDSITAQIVLHAACCVGSRTLLRDGIDSLRRAQPTQ